MTLTQPEKIAKELDSKSNTKKIKALSNLKVDCHILSPQGGFEYYVLVNVLGWGVTWDSGHLHGAKRSCVLAKVYFKVWNQQII